MSAVSMQELAGSQEKVTKVQVSSHGGTWEVVHTRNWPFAAFIERIFPEFTGAEGPQPGNPRSVRAQGPLSLESEANQLTRTVYYKASPLNARSARRYAWRQILLQHPLPRMREFQNLVWLRKHLFHAPRPVAAGVWTSGSGLARRPRQQWLCTEWLEDHLPWQAAWDAAQPNEQDVRLERFAAELARMHALGFVHRDCFPRNLMVHATRIERPAAFLDAWAGGPGWSRRGPAYDLACFSLAWPAAWSRAQQQRFLDVYIKSRAQQGRPLRNPGRFLRKVARNRAARWKREARSGGIYAARAYRDGSIFTQP